MKPVSFSINAMPGSGKTYVLDTCVLLSLLEKAMGARKRVFISHAYDDLLDDKRRLLEILNRLDQEADTGECASIILLGDPHQCLPWFLREFDDRDGSVAPSRAQLQSIHARLKILILSAVCEIDTAVRIFLSIAEKPKHPATDFLIERRWFLLHGVHPPHPLLTAVSNWSLGRACSTLVSAT